MQAKIKVLHLKGINNDKYCNIYDMSGNACEWTTESWHYSSGSTDNDDWTIRGGYYSAGADDALGCTYVRDFKYGTTSDCRGLRSLLYVK